MRSIFAGLTAAAMFAALGASAQEPEPQAAQAPRLDEIMTSQQQRHIKLWFAGQAGNWRLADYEVDALQEGFEAVDKLLGGDTVEQMVGGPMKDLQKAIDEKNSAAFTAAFDQLSTGCNSCHRTLDHAFIAIQRPTLMPYSNQSFAPQQ
jgi:hypothetical protein